VTYAEIFDPARSPVAAALEPGCVVGLGVGQLRRAAARVWQRFDEHERQSRKTAHG